MVLRVWLVEFVCHLDPQNSLHHSFGNCFLSALFEKYQELVQISTGNIFINSLAHRQKNRLMQFALLLEPFISQVCSCYVLTVMHCIVHGVFIYWTLCWHWSITGWWWESLWAVSGFLGSWDAAFGPTLPGVDVYEARVKISRPGG